MNVAALCRDIAGVILPTGADKLWVNHLSYDSRTAKQGSLFVATVGTAFDSHVCLADVAKIPVIAAVCQIGCQLPCPAHLPQVWVPDSRYALAHIAQVFYGNPSAQLQLIGITGTNGKTTTTALLTAIFAKAYHPRSVGQVGTLGTIYGDQHVSQSLTTPTAPALLATLAKMQQHGIHTVTMEVSSIALDQARVAGLAFDAAVFTNLSPEHLDYHHTMERYAAAKAKLQQQLKNHGHCIVNCDDQWLRCLGQPNAIGFSCKGTTTTAAVFLQQHQTTASGLSLIASVNGNFYAFQSPLQGRFNLENILAAIATAAALGIDIQTIAAGLQSCQGVKGRMEHVAPQVVVDYAHTPVALAQALQAMRAMTPTPNRLFCVFGCGGDRDRQKRPLMGATAAKYADVVVVTNDNPRSEDPAAITANIVSGMAQTAVPYWVIPDRREAIAWALTACAPGDWVLLAGKGHEIEPFSDADCALSVLASLGRCN